MADKATLTPKQQDVAQAMFKTDGDVAKAAKKLKITPSGVYGHLRRMKAAGYNEYGAYMGGGNGRSSNGTPDLGNAALTAAVKSFVESVEAAKQAATRAERTLFNLKPLRRDFRCMLYGR